MVPGKRSYPVIRYVIWSVAGACILFGVFGILIHDLLSSVGISDVRTFGWVAVGAGIAIYLVEGFVFYEKKEG